ncbi:Uri superfamily endonuclease [Methanohalophilus levihalophilus]|uniref:GIY-YIG nuclease family protein n=1 Tax=Methanohalophilus levihalophilus TaxID=1431282 RepID=UPI001AE6AA7C|nr:GIY-YIG nuclease family protein [Methanohalophilus levihalophilus]MBP2031249.1 Uri superfamily endonuclease [Methanohalophilus levihalophilus]
MAEGFPKGTYCLILKCDGGTEVVGSLGEIDFESGYYFYVGSALGSGGLKRMHRHISLSERRRNDSAKKPRWHIDYLLLSPLFALEEAVYVESEKRIECLLAGKFDSGISRFGCSDCSCDSHLFYREKCPIEEIKKSIIEMSLIPQTAKK